MTADEPIETPASRSPSLLALALVLLLVASALSLVAGHRGRAISVFDEATHADYAYQLVQGNIPHKGSILAPEIREEWSCRGTWRPVVKVPACSAPVKSPRDYPAGGQNYNFGHPPLYYGVTGAAVAVADAVIPGEHFVALARATGALWLFAAMLVLLLALRRLGCAWPYALGAALLLPATPLVLHASSAVTNDAAAPLCGAVALFLLARILTDRNYGWLLPAVASGLIAATKVLNALPLLFLAAGLVLLLGYQRWRQPDEDEDGNEDERTVRLDVAGTLRVCAALIVPFLLVYAGWQVFQSGRGPADWQSPVAGISERPIVGLPFNDLLSTSFAGFHPALGYYLPVQISRPSVDAWARLLNALLVAGPLLAMAVSRTRTRTWLVGAFALLAVTGYPLVVELQIYLQHRTYFPAIISRYGISILPLLVAGLALVAHRRQLLRTTGAVTLLGLVVMSLAVTGLG